MMITTTLKQLEHPPSFETQMIDLAKRHCERHVKVNEFGIMGDVLFWTLHHVLGREEFQGATEQAWIRVYSSMLKHIIPAMITYERQSHHTQEILIACNQPKEHT